MKKIIFLVITILLLIGCEKNTIQNQPKRALVETETTDLKTGITVYSGWKEVLILEEKVDMVKVKWVDGGDIKWITNTDKGFKRLD